MESKRTVIIFSAFYEPWVSGAERFVVEIVNRLKGRYRFVIYTCRLSRDVPRNEDFDGYSVIRLGFGWRVDKYLYPVFAAMAAALRPADLAHAVLESYAGVALWLFKFLRPGIPTILTLQSGDLDTPEKQRRIPRWLWNRIHRAPAHITAISSSLAQRATSVRGSSSAVTIIPNGVDCGGVPKADPVPDRIVCVARLSWEKGLKYLLEAFSIIGPERPGAELVLVGDGPDRPELEKKARELGFSHRIHFRGRLPHGEALKEMAKASVFVCPSLAEGLGTVFIEAQAIRVPVIGTDVGGIPDVIQNGATGITVPPRNSKALAAAIREMLTNDALASRCVQRAHDNVSRFNWVNICEDLEALYEHLLGNHATLENKKIAKHSSKSETANPGPQDYQADSRPRLPSTQGATGGN